MSPGLLYASITWGALTTILVILLIYRSTLIMQEDDQLFLDEAEAHMAQDQLEVMAKVNRVTPLVKILGAACGIMALVLASVFVYQGLNS